MSHQARQKLVSLRRKQQALDAEIDATIKLAFPAGCFVSYEHGQNLCSAKVVEAGGEDLRLMGKHSIYWMCVWRVLRAEGYLK